MKVQVILSTMHQTDYSLVERIGLESDVVIVNQCDKDSVECLEHNGYKVVWINSKERGLSRSRNLALKNADSDICLIADDDEALQSGYTSIIEDAFTRHKDASVIGFQAEGIDSLFKTYSGDEGRIGFIKYMRMASVEIAFKRQDLIDNNIKFNENIGAGTKYKMGEENTLLFNCLSAGLHIYYVPKLICKIYVGESTWFTGFDDDYFYSRGAVFTAMSNKWALLLILQFAVRKYGIYKSTTTFCKAMKLMLAGRKEYLNLGMK
jgi:glycosyltransferase involved in cell wall biosynthesis